MVTFEKLVSRSVVRFLSMELDLSGIKTSVERVLQIGIIGGILILVLVSYLLFFAMKVNVAISAIIGIAAAVMFEIAIYMIIEFRIDQRKTFVESILADYLQLVAANVRSGISLDKAMILATRPEFKYFSDDVKLIEKQLYGGETIQNALISLGKRYRSLQLQHTIRMMTEAIQYGGGMTDLLNQVAKDIRSQQMIQKEISGQMFMYTIFIAFAALIGAPLLYALTSQMVTITDTVWAGILQQNPGGLPTAGISFLKPSPPKITAAQYNDFALAAIVIITGFGSLIVSSISSGSVIKGFRYLPVFVIIGIVIFFVIGTVIKGLFAAIGTT